MASAGWISIDVVTLAFCRKPSEVKQKINDKSFMYMELYMVLHGTTLMHYPINSRLKQGKATEKGLT